MKRQEKNRQRQKMNRRRLAPTTPGKSLVQQPFDPQVAKGIHLAYIAERWELLAAIAWKEYIAHGRGALILEPDEERDWDATYMPLQECDSNTVTKELADMVRLYDPNSQIVAVFISPPQYTNGYLGGLTPERPSPPEAYKQLKGLIMVN